jgi:hypothetical protein
MIMRRFKFRILPALAAAALALSACESSNSITTPNNSAFRAPQADVTGGSVVFLAVPGDLLGDSTISGGGHGALTGSATFGPQGGTLYVATHKLVVPAHTVAQGTVFTMTISPDNYLQVSLTATSRKAPAGSNDVGALGFKNPLELYLNYGSAPPSNYRIAWRTPAGVLMPVPSHIEDTYICGSISHFTDYVTIE